MEEPKLIVEIKQRGHLYTVEQMEPVFDLLFDNYFGRCKSMEFRDTTEQYDYRVYDYFDREEFTALFFNPTENTSYQIAPNESIAYVFFETTTAKGQANCLLIRSQKQNRLLITLTQEELKNLGGESIILNFLQKVYQYFDVVNVKAAPHPDLMNVYETEDLEEEELLFDQYLGWVHLISKSIYDGIYLDHEDLLEAPAYKVEEWSKDVLFLQVYENLFAFEDPENRSRIIKLNQFLNEKYL